MDDVRKTIEVVAAVVTHAGRVMAVKKGVTRHAYTSCRWEFPGGKIEAGETPQQALARELREEMLMAVEVREHIITVTHDYPDFTIVMHAYHCTVQSTQCTLTEHTAVEWLAPAELLTLDWCPADKPIARAVADNPPELSESADCLNCCD